MRLYQLSALLVSTGILLSGCYLGRPSVDRSKIASAASVDEVCHVSGVPIAAESVLAAASIPVALLGYLYVSLTMSSRRSYDPVLIPLALGGFFAADAMAGGRAEEECSDARAEWRIMKMREQRQPSAWDLPQPPAGPVPP